MGSLCALPSVAPSSGSLCSSPPGSSSIRTQEEERGGLQLDRKSELSREQSVLQAVPSEALGDLALFWVSLLICSGNQFGSQRTKLLETAPIKLLASAC